MLPGLRLFEANVPPMRGRRANPPLDVIRLWRKRAQWLQSHSGGRAFQVLVAVFFVTNLVYHVLHKPIEMFSPVSGGFNKTPIETWRPYAPLFREYSTASSIRTEGVGPAPNHMR